MEEWNILFNESILCEKKVRTQILYLPNKTINLPPLPPHFRAYAEPTYVPRSRARERLTAGGEAIPELEEYKLLVLPPPATSIMPWPLEEEAERKSDYERARLALNRYNRNRELYGQVCDTGKILSLNPEAGFTFCQDGYEGYFNDQDLLCCEPKQKRQEQSLTPSILYTHALCGESLPTSEQVTSGRRERLEKIAMEKIAARAQALASKRAQI